MSKVLGLHHITAIAGSAQENVAFYTAILGLRLVKKTVNFDDPGTYHFYYGDEYGRPGTILTFFPWQHMAKGRNGAGMATEIAYSIPKGSMSFWEKHLQKNGVSLDHKVERFGDIYQPFTDPDGLQLSMVETGLEDNRQGWQVPEIDQGVATKGFFNTTLTLRELEPTARILTDLLDYDQVAQEGNRFRFVNPHVTSANTIDIWVDPKAQRGSNLAGTNHHIAFTVENSEDQMKLREEILSAGLHITPQIDRDYFHSLYFREPGGVLFEIATKQPGFTVDEPLDRLGQALKLPKQFEAHRNEIEAVLPVIKETR